MTTKTFTQRTLQKFADLQTNHAVVLARRCDWFPPKNGNLEELDDLKNAFIAKKITAPDVSLVAPIANWEEGRSYDTWDGRNFFQDRSFVFTDEKNVYKVIRGDTVSTVRPTGKGLSNFETADGYIWRYMFSVGTADYLKFCIAGLVPVKEVGDSDQQAVVLNTVSGQIDFVQIIAAGVGYKTPSIVIRGDGSGATATVQKNAITGKIDSVTITNPGSGYTWAEAVLTDSDSNPGSGFVSQVVFSPVGGHGKNIIQELSNVSILVSKDFDTIDVQESGTVQYGRVLLVDGISNISNDTGNTLRLGKRVQLTSITGSFQVGDKITDASGNSAWITGITTDNKVVLVDSQGTLSGTVTSPRGDTASLGVLTDYSKAGSATVEVKDYFLSRSLDSTTVKFSLA